jgi:Spy/CpxP family protein refolding chaperone
MTEPTRQSLSWPSIVIAGSLILFLFSPPVLANEKGHKGSYSSHHDKGHQGYEDKHQGKGYSGHKNGHQGHGYGKHPGPHQSASEFIQHVLKFKKPMAITDEQEDKLRAINLAFKKTRIKMKAEVKLANLDLHELLRDDQASLSDIESKLKTVHALKADLHMASIKARREAKAVLTEEQRKRMKAVHERIKAMGKGAMGKGAMGGGHPGGYPHHGKGQGKENEKY